MKGWLDRADAGFREGTLHGVAWYNSNSHETTHAVGQKQANPWGLYDMHGNVLEWCADWLAEYPVGSVADPTGPGTGTFRVLRGGAWNAYPQGCRSAFRHGVSPSGFVKVFGNGGFRVFVNNSSIRAAMV